MNDKEIRVNLDGLKMMDERMLAALIDSLVEHYTNKFGLDSLSDMPEPPPNKPTYDCEDLSIAKEYLKKFRLQ